MNALAWTVFWKLHWRHCQSWNVARGAFSIYIWSHLDPIQGVMCGMKCIAEGMNYIPRPVDFVVLFAFSLYYFIQIAYIIALNISWLSLRRLTPWTNDSSLVCCTFIRTRTHTHTHKNTHAYTLCYTYTFHEKTYIYSYLLTCSLFYFGALL